MLINQRVHKQICNESRNAVVKQIRTERSEFESLASRASKESAHHQTLLQDAFNAINDMHRIPPMLDAAFGEIHRVVQETPQPTLSDEVLAEIAEQMLNDHGGPLSTGLAAAAHVVNSIATSPINLVQTLGVHLGVTPYPTPPVSTHVWGGNQGPRQPSFDAGLRDVGSSAGMSDAVAFAYRMSCSVFDASLAVRTMLLANNTANITEKEVPNVALTTGGTCSIM